MFQGFKVLSVGQGAGLLFPEDPAPHQLPWPYLPCAQGDAYVRVRLCSPKAGPGLILAPGPATTWLASCILVPLGPQGTCGIVGERSLCVQALGPGVGSWGSPNLCPRLAPMRPALIGHPFLLSFNILIPTFKMGRKVP